MSESVECGCCENDKSLLLTLAPHFKLHRIVLARDTAR
jgi:hypothetical protein